MKASAPEAATAEAATATTKSERLVRNEGRPYKEGGREAYENFTHSTDFTSQKLAQTAQRAGLLIWINAPPRAGHLGFDQNV